MLYIKYCLIVLTLLSCSNSKGGDRSDDVDLKTARAYYYEGIDEFEQDNYVNAVSNYLQALRKCEDKELKALIYKSLYGCFSSTFCYDEALECAKRAKVFSDDGVINEDIKYCLANIRFEDGRYDEAMELFEELLKNSVKPDISEYEYGVAKCFYHENVLDSAIHHYEAALSGDRHIVSAAAADLVELYREQCDTTSIYLKYSDLYFSLHYNMNIGISASSKMIAMFHDFCNDEVVDKERFKRKRLFYFALVTLIVSGTAALYLLIRYKKRKENEIDAIRKSIENHRNNIEKAREKGMGVVFVTRLNDLENSNICILLKDRLLKHNVSRKTISDCYDCALTNREIALLSNTANWCFPDFSTLLVEELGVKGENITYCILCLLGFSIIEIAVLMKISYQAAHKRVTMLKEIMKIDGDVKEFLIGYFGDVYF